MKYIIKLRYGHGSVDDIDHLGNRRIRTVGEQLASNLILVWQEWLVQLKNV